MTKSRDLANAATALNAVTATELGYVDGVTSAIQTQIDTKLATATATTTYVANTNNFTAGKNAIINGAFNVWQRGTSNTTTASAYTADRWQKGGQTIFGVSRQLTSDTTNLPTIQYCARVQRTAGSTSTAGWDFAQSLESATSQRFVGQTVVLSYYARKGADFSSASSALTPQIYYGTGTDQSIIGTYTGATNVGGTTATLTTTWQRFSTSVSIPVTATEMAINFYCAGVGTAGTNDYYEITGVQLEIGSTATAFQTASGTIGGELALCQRYYQLFGKNSSYYPMGTGFVQSATTVNIVLPFLASMRIYPTAVESGGTIQVIQSNWTTSTATSFTLPSSGAESGTNAAKLQMATTGLTANYPCLLRAANDTTAYLAFSAEL